MPLPGLWSHDSLEPRATGTAVSWYDVGLAPELVRQGRANRAERIERKLSELAQSYDDVVPQLFRDAPSYREAADIVWPRIKSLIP